MRESERVEIKLSHRNTQQLWKILLIDDDEDIRELTLMCLAGEFEVRQAESGPDGLALAREFSPDLILLDSSMPEMDGPATLAELRRDPSLAGIPVVFLTGKSQLDQLELLNPLAVLRKPFDPLSLSGELTKLLTSL